MGKPAKSAGSQPLVLLLGGSSASTSTMPTGTRVPVAVPSGIPESKLLRRKSVPSTKVVGFGLTRISCRILLEVGELELLDLGGVPGGPELRDDVVDRGLVARPTGRAIAELIGDLLECLQVVHHPLEGDGFGQLLHRIVVRRRESRGCESHGCCQGTGRDHGTRPTRLERHYAGTPLVPPPAGLRSDGQT